MLYIIKCIFVLDLVAKFCPSLRAVICENMAYLTHDIMKTYVSSILAYPFTFSKLLNLFEHLTFLSLKWRKSSLPSLHLFEEQNEKLGMKAGGKI